MLCHPCQHCPEVQCLHNCHNFIPSDGLRNQMVVAIWSPLPQHLILLGEWCPLWSRVASVHLQNNIFFNFEKNNLCEKKFYKKRKGRSTVPVLPVRVSAENLLVLPEVLLLSIQTGLVDYLIDVDVPWKSL
jgi:hypothetical protein